MTPSLVPTDKRLLAKRTIRRMAKRVRASAKSPSGKGCSGGIREILENSISQSDEVSKICSNQLLLLRLQLKDKLRSYFNSECSVDDLVEHTRLKREAVNGILEKHYAFLRDEKEYVSDDDGEHEDPSPVSAKGRPKEANVTFIVPKLDMSDVRKGAASSDENDTSRSADGTIQEIPRQPKPSTPSQSLIQEQTILSKQSPREVTDSSAEISDLAKRLGARLLKPDTCVLEQLRNVRREKSFVEQLREIVTSSKIAESPVKQLQFIPSTPIARRSVPVTVACREIDVQTSVQFGESPLIAKELRDTATDVPSLDYLSTSELGGMRQIPADFVAQQDASSSEFNSDQSVGQVPTSMISQARAIIAVNCDGSAQVTPGKVATISEIVEDSFPSHCMDRKSTRCRQATTQETITNVSPRTPRVSESPWRPSSRRLHLEEVDISTSQESTSIEVVSVGTPAQRPPAQPRINLDDMKTEQKGVAHDSSLTEISSKNSSDLSHQDEEHTYNQVSQIASE